MIKKNLIKKTALGLGIAAFLIGSVNVGTAFAQPGGGVSSSSQGSISPQDSALFEKQRELDQFLFVDQVKEIEGMGFKVIYTGVADDYVEVGITPYNDEYAAYIYDEFGRDIVKVVDTDEVILYDSVGVAPDAVTIDADNAVSSETPIMDMGDTPVTAGAEDEALIREREQLMADEEEKLTIQIESIDGSEPAEAMDPELIRQTGIVDDLADADMAEDASDDGADIRLLAAEDSMVTTTSAKDIENEDKGLPTASVIAVVISGGLIIGGTAYLSAKKRTGKKQ